MYDEDLEIDVKLVKRILKKYKMRGDEVLLETSSGEEMSSFDWICYFIESSRFDVDDVESFNNEEFKLLVVID